MIIQERSLALRGALGQDIPTLPAPAASYQEAFDAAFRTCEDMLGSEECRRMLGYIPFVCPPPAQRPASSHPLFWLGLGLLVSKVFL